jgi:ribosome-associated heat shock protein Hsp15
LRLDKYLFFARLLSSRSAAANLCQSRHLRLDGRVIEKAHANVRIGSVISFPAHDTVISVRVRQLPVRRGPFPEACTMYEDLMGSLTRSRQDVAKNLTAMN